jgi:hypothetical protein
MATADFELIRKELAEVQDDPRRDLVDAFQVVAVRSAVAEAKESSVDELRRWTEASGSVLDLLRHLRGPVLLRVLEVLDELAESDELGDEALESWGRLQVLATYDQIRDECYTIRWLDEHGRSRQQVNTWKKARRLLAIAGLPGVKGHAYPKWQFDERLRPKTWMRPVLDAADDAGFDPVALHRFMLSPTAVPSRFEGHGRNLVAVADAGDVDDVVELVRAGNSQSG